jgi:hypothetical protein
MPLRSYAWQTPVLERILRALHADHGPRSGYTRAPEIAAMWVRNVHAGGRAIPEPVKGRTRQRILEHAEKNYAGKYTRLDIRFKGAFCYIDAFVDEPGRTRDLPIHLCRLRYFQADRWSVAFFTYSHERYEPTFFASGEDQGTPEEGFDIGAVYLQ